MTAEGAQALASALEFNDSLRALRLPHNAAGGVGAAALAEALKFNETLEELDLFNNKIADEGMRHLGDALTRGAAPAIKEVGWSGLQIDGNPASDAAKQAVQDALKNRK